MEVIDCSSWSAYFNGQLGCMTLFNLATRVLSLYGCIFLTKVSNKGIKDVSGSGDCVALLFLHVTDGSCLSTFDHFKNMEEEGFIHFIMGVIV